MKVSATAKAVLGISVVLAVIAYLLILELGFNAGRIHPGVSVGGLDVGGMTIEEAVEALQVRGLELRKTPITFQSDGLGPLTFVPGRLGWRPFPDESAAAAMDVGRKDAPFGALADRISAWLGGVTVEWAGSPNPGNVTRLLSDWEELATEAGISIDRGELRQRIRRAIETWPRADSYEIPLE